MNAEADDRLVRLRAEWPSRVRWREVRERRPGAVVEGLVGPILLLAAGAALLLLSGIETGWPVAIAPPAWFPRLDALLRPLLVFGGILLLVSGALCCAAPFRARREIAFARFAETHGLGFSGSSEQVELGGLFFADAVSRKPGRGSAAGAPTTIRFRAEYALRRGAAPWRPDLQIAIAGRSHGGSGAQGVRTRFRYLHYRLPRSLPHLFLDSRTNGVLRGVLAGAQRLSLEGDFDRYFAAYAPEGYGRDALEILTPDVMAGLIDYGRRWDVEVHGDRLLVVSYECAGRADRDETTALLRFAETVAGAFAHQASTYSDGRAGRPHREVAEAGRGLRLRRAMPATLVAGAVVLVSLGVAFLPVLLARL